MWKMQKHWSNSQNDGQHKISSLADYILWYIHTAVRLYNMKALCECLRAETHSMFCLSLAQFHLTRSGWSATFCCVFFFFSTAVNVWVWFVYFICAETSVFVRISKISNCWCIRMFDIQSYNRQRILYTQTNPLNHIHINEQSANAHKDNTNLGISMRCLCVKRQRLLKCGTFTLVLVCFSLSLKYFPFVVIQLWLCACVCTFVHIYFIFVQLLIWTICWTRSAAIVQMTKMSTPHSILHCI